ncbi:MAG: glycine--tRNA ligase subunit beta, partial [Bacteroidales bacterium]
STRKDHMDRELLIEIGCEELPASWLPALTRQIGEHLGTLLTEARMPAESPIETFSTPRRLTARVTRIPERQSDQDDLVMGPPVAAAMGADGPTPALLGFARKQGVEVKELETRQTPKGEYYACVRRRRGKAAIDVLPEVMGGLLRKMSFPKQMRWDAWLDDERGELTFGRPIRWLVLLFGGRVVPFTIKRTEASQSPQLQEVRSAAITYGHRFLSTSGRAGRAIKVRTFDDYRARLLENFVVLDRGERHDKIGRELDAHARRLGGRVSPMASHSGLLQEVPDLVEYPSVIAGTYAPEFLELPAEVLTTTMVHHQHYFPVVNRSGQLMPAFLAVVNTEPDQGRTIARNSERVLTARLRDARFFWDHDRRKTLDARVADLSSILFHKKLGSYREKAERLGRLASVVALDLCGDQAVADFAGWAGRLAKADLTTDMVRELTELQGTMGGIYAKEEGLPEAVWRAIYYQYLPQGVEPTSPPTREELGAAASSWAATALADKLDTLVGMFAVGERPTGTRDPFGLRRQAHGALRILVDLPELTGATNAVSLEPLVFERVLPLLSGAIGNAEPDLKPLLAFLADRLRYVLEQRGFAYDEVNAVLRTDDPRWSRLNPLDARRRLEALRAVRGSADFEALAVAFKRVKNLSRELDRIVEDENRLTEPAERDLAQEYRTRGAAVRAAIRAGNYVNAFRQASGFRPAVDKFFTDVFVMVDDQDVRRQRLSLLSRLHELLLELADISEIVPRTT